MPKVSWQRGLDPKPPDQTAPFLIWQLAPPSHPCSGFSPQPFLREPASPQPELGRGTQDLPRPTGSRHHELASQVAERSLWVHMCRPGFLKEVGPKGPEGWGILEREKKKRARG